MSHAPIADNAGADKAVSSPSADPITVVHLLHTMAYGGIETIVINWLRDVDRNRFDLRLVCFENPGGGGSEEPFVEAATRAGFAVHKIPWHKGKPVRRAARELARLMRQCDARIVHTHNTYADVVGYLAAQQTGAKAVASLYVWGEFTWKRNILQFIDTWFLRRFDHVVCQCEKTRADTIHRRIAADKVSVVDAGFPIQTADMTAEQRSARRREFGAEDDHVVLVNVARLYPEKAHDHLLRSFKLLRESCPQARLWIAGVGPLEAEVKELCTQLGLDPYVRWIGFTDDLWQLFALADIQVHPTDNEGIPLAIVHGMAAAMPIVATAVGGVPEVLTDGESGRLIQPRDEQAFIDATLELIHDPTRAAALGQAAQRFVAEEYSQAKGVERLTNLYASLI